MAEDERRRIPAVHQLLAQPALQHCAARLGQTVVRQFTRRYLDQLRANLGTGAAQSSVPGPSELATQIAEWIRTRARPLLRPVVNATGILLHTGLGRAPLAAEAIQAVQDIALGYCNLEVDLESGERSQRVLTVQGWLCSLTRAEAATVVNNNAAATLVTLAAIAAGKEVLVSRGELIEIGGSFRLPEVMAQSGAILREVGTTNKTRLEDYARAIGPQTAMLLKVHTSNYRIVGFTEETDLADLVALAQQHQLPLVHDIGSGAVIDFEQFGTRGEPVAQRSLAAGADLVLFSGDKLLGGPQCGIIVGRKNLVEHIQKHPLSRAVRVDKMTLAALEATLLLYQDPQLAQRRIPLLQLLTTPLENLHERAVRLAEQLARLPLVKCVTVVADQSYLGGGSLPAQALATWCVTVEPQGLSVDQLAQRLRTAPFPVVGRIAHRRLLLDLRSVLPDQDATILEQFRQIDSTSEDAPKA